jgi:hypothetical protein
MVYTTNKNKKIKGGGLIYAVVSLYGISRYYYYYYYMEKHYNSTKVTNTKKYETQ